MPCKHRVSRPLLWTTAFPRGLINPADSVLTKSLRTPIPSSSGIHTLATASGVTCRPQRRLTSSRPCRAARYDREAASSIADARRSQTLGKREIACEVVVIDVKVISRHWLGNRALRTVEWRFGCILQDLGVKRSGRLTFSCSLAQPVTGWQSAKRRHRALPCKTAESPLSAAANPTPCPFADWSRKV